jgi:hypothetical protein
LITIAMYTTICRRRESPEGLTCLVTMEDISTDLGNYVEYQSYPSMKWQPALFEKEVIENLLDTQFYDYVKRARTTDCQAELRRLLESGPPQWISDPHGLPLAEETDTHVCQLWYSSDYRLKGARLDGSYDGEERQQLWDELKQFIVVEGKEEGDDDEKANGDATNSK